MFGSLCTPGTEPNWSSGFLNVSTGCILSMIPDCIKRFFALGRFYRAG
jgi:hypothetical protein